jgi:beta-lactamase regulating signal transducer with metallopeptidase domain
MIATWMLYSTLVSACAACIALVADTMLRASRRPTRWVWTATFVVGAAVPALVAIRPRAASVAGGGESIFRGVEVTEVAPVARMTIDAWVGVAWIASAAIVSMLLLVGLVQLSRARRRADRGTLAGREVALTTDLGPGALPFGEPKILVPRWASSLPADAARLLVAHEDEHVRAGDARLLVGAAVVLAAMPWNVVLWWSLRRLRTAIELDCDARVLRRESSVAPYAELLLQVAGRGRAAPALLALTDSTSQLKTRIDAMTMARVLTPVRRAALGALAVAALVVACETHRPDPVAPVTDYVLRDGRTTALAGNPQLADSVKLRLAEKMRDVAPGSLADDSRARVLMVHDAAGKVVFAGSIDSSNVLKEIAADDIATVEVVGRRDLLPGQARGGLVSVTLKPEARWTSPTAGDTSVHYKSLAPIEEVVTPASPKLAPVSRERAELSANVRVVLEDGTGAVIYDGPAGEAKFQDGAGPYRFGRDAIATVNVYKGGRGPDTIRIRLKEGARVEKR